MIPDDHVLVRFKINMAPYCKGETAAFYKPVAERMEGKGYVSIIGQVEGGIPMGEDGDDEDGDETLDAQHEELKNTEETPEPPARPFLRSRLVRKG